MTKIPLAKCSVFVATSLDGFIARSDGNIDWLEEANTLIPAGEDCGYGQFMATVDGLVMGRSSFEQVLAFPAWLYGATPVVVLSRKLTALPAGTPSTVELSSEAPAELVSQLSAQGRRHLYVDGGVTIQSFLAAGLIDQIIVTVIPVLIGSGRPLFGPLTADIHLELVATRGFEFGFVQSTYRVVHNN